MFGLKKKTAVFAPCAGKVCELDIAPDPAFAEALIGPGFVLAPENEVTNVCAPVDGELVTVFPTRHAFAMRTDDGLEVLVHIGIDTVRLGGAGFEVLQEQGARLKQGTPVIRAAIQCISTAGLSPLIPVVMTNKKKIDSVTVKCRESATSEDVACHVALR
ncbi:PTS sugar transporter subunit IIA [Corynebacterium sp. H128]|uniref:PTS sugar transporter subunit IIA n=1 Tax=unclassified Corynebacterium TaxID=2624378 RepID=UPI00403F5311